MSLIPDWTSLYVWKAVIILSFMCLGKYSKSLHLDPCRFPQWDPASEDAFSPLHLMSSWLYPFHVYPPQLELGTSLCMEAHGLVVRATWCPLYQVSPLKSFTLSCMHTDITHPMQSKFSVLKACAYIQESTKKVGFTCLSSWGFRNYWGIAFGRQRSFLWKQKGK